jgi:hypothetical protein
MQVAVQASSLGIGMQSNRIEVDTEADLQTASELDGQWSATSRRG